LAARFPPALSPATAIVSVAVQLVDILHNPRVCGPSVVVRGRELVFRRVTVLHGYDDRVRAKRHGARCTVVDVDVGYDPSAAVIVDHNGERTLASGNIDPCSYPTLF